MTDWIEQHYREQRQKQGQKGGPGSGHFGHAGRPGKRGGSLPGKSGAYRPGGYRRFTEAEEATRWREEHYGDWADKADWFGLYMVEQYTGEGFGQINAYLRGQNEKLGWSEREFESREKSLKDGIDALDKTLKIIKTPEPIVLHRGACPREKCKERFSQLQPGDEFVDLGYTSTSLIDHPKFDYRHVQIQINVPAGTDGLAIPDTGSKNRGELEFLLPRGSRFRVKDMATNGKMFIELDLVGRE